MIDLITRPLVNDHASFSDPLENSALKMVHPLAAGPAKDKSPVLVVPSWIDSIPSKVEIARAILEVFTAGE